MGNNDSKLSTYRAAINELTGRQGPAPADDEAFWSQFWHDNHIEAVGDVFTVLTAAEIRALRDHHPENLATLCYKAVEQLVRVTDTLCNTVQQQKTVLSCVALLTRLLPYVFEEADWRASFFWSTLPHASHQMDLLANMPLAQSLLLALADLLFCPDFTVAPLDSTGSGSGKDSKSGSSSRFGVPDSPPDDLQSIDSCEYIWEAGVGCSMSSPSSAQYDHNRTALLRLLLTCFSESMYCSTAEVGRTPNAWIDFFSSAENRHALPLFTSLLNTVFAYNPNGGLLPFNHLLFSDSKEPLVEVALQLLIVTTTMNTSSPPLSICSEQSPLHLNLFINYLSRIHREDDFEFLLRGFTRLLNNPLAQSYLPNSNKRIAFHQELLLLVLFWKLCDYNKKFMHYVLKTCDVLQILVPILYHLNDARADRSRVGLVHIGVFILLLLSGERNFGVRLNRPYLATAPMDLPIFSGTHADLLVVVFHKLITTGHTRLQPLFDCLLTILVNVSPYLKTLSMVAAAKVLHLLEAFSTPWFLFSNPSNHHLVFFLLEIFNNIIQYQFDGN
ncbi:PREDICTED: protein HID1-like, partial [Rhagoletis zephyria]|uniref:protein HID1-like n=1 Tax=Rhagoletis zephyria TaxID=28612 RepID=UPI00081133D2